MYLNWSFLFRCTQAGTKESPSTVVPSVKILGLEVRFAVRNEVKKVPSFLRCFPNIQTLHVKVNFVTASS
jgi:hypothetical protein